MEEQEIKKKLYQQKPTAKIRHIQNGIAYYFTTIELNDGKKLIYFEIPVNDMGEAKFTPFMEAQHLNRWLKV